MPASLEPRDVTIAAPALAAGARVEARRIAVVSFPRRTPIGGDFELLIPFSSLQTVNLARLPPLAPSGMVVEREENAVSRPRSHQRM